MAQGKSLSDSQNKFIFFLPNIFTALNMGCGFTSIIFSINGNFYKASMLLILGAIFDSVDGRVARLTGTQSAFGEQFDSMSDLISFGMAPAVLFYLNFLTDLKRLGIVLGFFFVLSGALRLARFNANIDRVPSQFFQGLPIPAGAMTLVGYVLLSQELEFLRSISTFAGALIFFLSFLMISNIPFNSFKNSDWVRNNKKLAFIIVVVTFGLTFTYEEITIFTVMILYLTFSLIYFLAKRNDFKDIFNPPQP